MNDGLEQAGKGLFFHMQQGNQVWFDEDTLRVNER